MNIEAEIEAYFAKISGGGYSGLFELELNLLDRPEAYSLTQSFSFHPVIKHLGGFLLDDPDTSNYHILLRQPPFEGHILFLAHDDNSRVVFPSLAALLKTADDAKVRGITLSELHPTVSPHSVDQAALSELIDRLVEEDEIEVVLCLIPSLDLSDIDLLNRLAAHEDFYLGEAVAEQIALHPSKTLTSVALRCSSHPHLQVAKAGERALRAIGA